MTNHKMLKEGKKGNPICDVFDYGKKRKLEIGEKNVYDFSMGNPSVPAPKEVQDAIVDVVNNIEISKLHSYTIEAGIKEIRDSIVDYINNKNNTNLSSDLMYLTSGASSALSITLKALLNEGEEVIVFAPYFPDYVNYINNANGRMVVVKSLEPDFNPDLDAFEKSISEKTKVVLINYPNNPSGALLSEEELIKMVDILERKQKEYNSTIYLFSDEPYRELVYNNEFVPYITNYYDNSLVCYSFSKSLSIPGERLGFILVNPKCKYASDVFTSIVASGRYLGYVCATSLFQYIIPKCLGASANFEIYKENRDLLYNELVKYGYHMSKPKGAFYIFMKTFDGDDMKFVEKAKKYDLLLVPGKAFGYSGYVRISYCVSKETIIKSLPAFKKLIEDYRGE